MTLELIVAAFTSELMAFYAQVTLTASHDITLTATSKTQLTSLTASLRQSVYYHIMPAQAL